MTCVQARIEEASKHLKRVIENPIRVARMYLGEQGDSTGSYARIAARFGVSRAEICYHVGLVNRLPEKFVTWLERQEDPEVLSVFSERRLRPITRNGNRHEQWKTLRELLGQLSRPILSGKEWDFPIGE